MTCKMYRLMRTKKRNQMKTNSNYSLRKLMFTFLFVAGAFAGIKATCTANFSFSVGAGGVVTFTSTSVGTGTNTSYYWNYGDGTNFMVMNNIYASHTYTTNM